MPTEICDKSFEKFSLFIWLPAWENDSSSTFFVHIHNSDLATEHILHYADETETSLCISCFPPPFLATFLVLNNQHATCSLCLYFSTNALSWSNSVAWDCSKSSTLFTMFWGTSLGHATGIRELMFLTMIGVCGCWLCVMATSPPLAITPPLSFFLTVILLSTLFFWLNIPNKVILVLWGYHHCPQKNHQWFFLLSRHPSSSIPCQLLLCLRSRLRKCDCLWCMLLCCWRDPIFCCNTSLAALSNQRSLCVSLSVLELVWMCWGQASWVNGDQTSICL